MKQTETQLNLTQTNIIEGQMSTLKFQPFKFALDFAYVCVCNVHLKGIEGRVQSIEVKILIFDKLKILDLSSIRLFPCFRVY